MNLLKVKETIKSKCIVSIYYLYFVKSLIRKNIIKNTFINLLQNIKEEIYFALLNKSNSFKKKIYFDYLTWYYFPEFSITYKSSFDNINIIFFEYFRYAFYFAFIYSSKIISEETIYIIEVFDFYKN